MEKIVKVRVPASSSNLGPGYESMGVALNLYSYLTAEITQYDMLEIIIAGSHTGASVPLDKSNAVYQAIEYVHNKLNLPLKGLKLTMELNSPISRGLGSSATAISAGVYIANELLGRPLSLQMMINIAATIEGHSASVVPITTGGFVISGRDGYNIVHAKAHFPPALKFIAVIPELEMSKIILPDTILVDDAVYNISMSAILTTALATNDYHLITKAMGDRIHQDFRGKLIPGAHEVMKAGVKAGALGCYLSGTGPTICAIVHENIDSIGAAMVEKWAESKIKAEYRILELDLEGIVLMQE